MVWVVDHDEAGFSVVRRFVNNPKLFIREKKSAIRYCSNGFSSLALAPNEARSSFATDETVLFGPVNLRK